MKHKTLLILAMLMSMAVCSMTLMSCSDDEPDKKEQKSEQPTEDPEKNTTDVAVTGPVLEYGALFADIKGVVNLNAITASYSKVGFGICVSETPDLNDGEDIWVDNLVGRTIKVHFLLKPSTKYYYATFVNVPTLSYVYWGKTYSFTTKPINKDAAVTGSVLDIGAFSAKISGTTNPKEVYAAGAKATAGIEIAEDAEFVESYQIKANDDIKKFNVEATSLAPNKKYYYRTYLLTTYYYDDDDPWEKEIYIYGDTQSFTTKPINEDAVVTGDATDIGMSSAKISGSTNLKYFEVGGINTSVGVEVSESDDFTKARKVSVTANVEKFNVEVTSLNPETKYYYRTYLKSSLNSQEHYYYGERKIFTTKGLDNSNHYVDLGLPSGTFWATMNVGASKPEDYGDYFAWGETKAKSDYSSSTYFDSSYSKYNTSGTKELLPEDDAAYVNWGKEWRMPTYEQLNELKNQCTWTWTSVNNVKGYLVEGKSGNAIFLPAAGYHRYDSSLYLAGSCGYYWSRTLHSSTSDYAWDLVFASGSVGMGCDYRYDGRCVRPVRSTE